MNSSITIKLTDIAMLGAIISFWILVDLLVV
jgi:hypothetical protein